MRIIFNKVSDYTLFSLLNDVMYGCEILNHDAIEVSVVFGFVDTAFLFLLIYLLSYTSLINARY